MFSVFLGILFSLTLEVRAAQCGSFDGFNLNDLVIDRWQDLRNVPDQVKADLVARLSQKWLHLDIRTFADEGFREYSGKVHYAQISAGLFEIISDLKIYSRSGQLLEIAGVGETHLIYFSEIVSLRIPLGPHKELGFGDRRKLKAFILKP